MRYITSKDYDRLVELLDNREHVIILTGIRSYFASYDKYKGYYIGNTWLEHDIEFCLFHSKDKEELKDFCAQEECEFIDPDFAEEMYEALGEAKKLILDLCYGWNHNVYRDQIQKTLDKIDFALKKARGVE